MDRELWIGGAHWRTHEWLGTVHDVPECGQHFCDRCGDCLACDAGDPCLGADGVDHGPHRWVTYLDDVFDDEEQARLRALLEAER